MKLSVLANLYGAKSLDETLAILSGLGVHTVEIGAGGRTATTLNGGDEATAGGTTRFLVANNDIYSPKAYGGSA